MKQSDDSFPEIKITYSSDNAINERQIPDFIPSENEPWNGIPDIKLVLLKQKSQNDDDDSLSIPLEGDFRCMGTPVESTAKTINKLLDVLKTASCKHVNSLLVTDHDVISSINNQANQSKASRELQRAAFFFVRNSLEHLAKRMLDDGQLHKEIQPALELLVELERVMS